MNGMFYMTSESTLKCNVHFIQYNAIILVNAVNLFRYIVHPRSIYAY